MIKIGSGRYQDVFRKEDKVFKIPIQPVSEKEFSRMEQYYKSLKAVGVNVPSYFGLIELQGKKASMWEYKGRPFFEAVLDLDSDETVDALRQIFQMSLSAYNQCVAFYPILEQFTLSEDGVFFIDFFPPRNKEDFKEYSKDKRVILSLMFYGLAQKLIRPSRQLLAIKPALRSKVKEFASEYLSENFLEKWTDQILNAINFVAPENLELDKAYVGINRKRIRYYSYPLEIEDSNEWILILPSGNIWSRELFNKDLDSIVSPV